MVGGAISGYCATGKVNKATAPIMVMKIDRTAAKIGRSMKKCEILMGLCSASGLRGFNLARSWRDLAAWPRAHQTIDHDLVRGLDSRADDSKPVDDRAKLDGLRRHRAVGRHRHHQFD